ncbi:hypothetical protein [Streptomyces canus]|uniref:hypothetical protein n=1 Tax=Streptomyces canus TaxID=58343 RepID=UPI00224D5FCB|nr:hypothetical protein [Streptomyces canus]MCX4853966.1 hypothetical protein [Streptomyces canus]
MRNTDPFVFFRQHSDTIYRLLGIAGALLLVFLLLRVWAMRWGGWRSAWARLRREVAVTRYAFTAPVRAWYRHRSSLRLLVRQLGTPATWRDAERALAAARLAAAPARPYAALVGTDSVAVLLAGTELPQPDPDGAWWAEPDEPERWLVARADLPSVTPEAADVRPIIVAVGDADRSAAFLDLAVGPPVLSVTGNDRAATALVQAVAAQLDVRLPSPLVVVAEGVHRDYPGPPVRSAYRTARETPPRLGIAPVLIAVELPDPLPPEFAAPPGGDPAVRAVVLGPGRAYVRSLLTDRHGRVAVTGTPLLARCGPLGRAVARVLPSIPPVLPPAPAAEASTGLSGRHARDLFEEEEGAGEAPRVSRSAPDASGTSLHKSGEAPLPGASRATGPRLEPAPAPGTSSTHS